MTTFAELGVSDAVVASLGDRGITEAFPIQTAAIEAGLAGRDICGKAPTGSGKTLAFGIPAVDLSNHGTPWCPAVLILSPTRELANQIKEELEPLAKSVGRSILTVYGGTNIERDIKRLEKGIDILVACPGRLEDLIARRCCELRNIELVVVDEADRMADMGFLPSVKRLLDQTPNNRHTLLFSATLDGDVDTLIKRYQKDPLTFEVEEQIGEIGDVEHSWYLIQPSHRIDSAVAVLQRYYSSIVFCRTRRGCDRVARMFQKKGLPAVAIHGDRSQSQRERALADFISGKAQVLVATDVAARGIHVDNVALVMHYDPAGSDKDYIHRSGRTGRAGQDGRVISMVVGDKKKIARQLQKELGLKPGFDDFDVEALGPIVDRPKPKPQPAAKKHDREPRGERDRGRDGDQSHSSSDRGSARNGKSRNRNDRNDRGGRATNRDRDERGRPAGRGKDSRDNDGRRKAGSKRDDRGRGGPKRGDDRDGKFSNRDDRRPDGKRQRPRRRPGSNDWYPPGYYDDDKRDGNKRDGERGSKRSTGQGRGQTGRGRTGASRDAERDDRPAGGSGTKKRKDRGTKGRHADKRANKNKGKPRKS